MPPRGDGIRSVSGVGTGPWAYHLGGFSLGGAGGWRARLGWIWIHPWSEAVSGAALDFPADTCPASQPCLPPGVCGRAHP